MNAQERLAFRLAPAGVSERAGDAIRNLAEAMLKAGLSEGKALRLISDLVYSIKDEYGD